MASRLMTRSLFFAGGSLRALADLSLRVDSESPPFLFVELKDELMALRLACANWKARSPERAASTGVRTRPVRTMALPAISDLTALDPGNEAPDEVVERTQVRAD